MLFPVGQSDMLAQQIIDLLKHPQKAKAMALAARQQIEQKFSLEQMVTKTAQIYAETCR
jgi:glycosyltransferase involved in cell wall biosynthesis